MLRDTHPGLRMVIAVVLAAAVLTLVPAAPVQRVALAWMSGAVVFLGLTLVVLAGGAPERLRERARLQDSSRWVIFVILVAAALASLVAAALLLQKQEGETPAATALRIVLAGGVVLSSWTLTHIMFALHYAHAFYGDGPAPGPDDARGLQFPGDQLPDFWDFVYFSMVIGMTCQVSDVQITARRLRHLATLHGALSFFFNTVILALTINLVVGAL
jgi:uncharacterized membrane protein